MDSDEHHEAASVALTLSSLGLRVLIRIFGKELVGVAAALPARLQLLRQQAKAAGEASPAAPNLQFRCVFLEASQTYLVCFEAVK